LSTVAYEAYEVNKPMLASIRAVCRIVVMHGQTGFLLPPGDRPAWRQQILQLAQDAASVRGWEFKAGVARCRGVPGPLGGKV